MPSFIHRLASAVPEVAYPQARVRDVMLGWLGGDRRTERLLKRVYDHSAIRRRHSVVRDLADSGGPFVDRDGGYRAPSTGLRNDLYREHARPLFGRAAAAALTGSAFEAADVTHVITVSCTGFYAPGPDYELVRDLGLDPRTRRCHLGFMGCYAALPALRMADAFCRADPDAVVLVVSAELCTLHLHPRRDLDSIVATAVFADGAAAALVSARAPAADAPALELRAFHTALVPEGEGDMAWTIGDHGFEMTLSSYVPALLEANLTEAVAPLFAADGAVEPDEVARWAVHPGGRAILDKAQAALGAPPEALAASRGVLADYGNMSSATVLFVLERLLAEGGEAGEPLAALAFGPGLTVEAALLARATTTPPRRSNAARADGTPRETVVATAADPAVAAARETGDESPGEPAGAPLPGRGEPVASD